MKGRAILLAAVGVLVVAGGAAAAVGFGGTASGVDEPGAAPPSTATVTRITLTATEDVDGVLGYGEAATVTGRLGGTVTALPPEGTTVSRGGELYRVDDQPVLLLYGALPLYRRLVAGVEGADVRQFEQNLAALGYRGFTVDDEYTSATADAVERWQERLGLPETGAVDVGRVVYAPDAVRVNERLATLGGSATGSLLSYTGTIRTVTVDLDVTKQHLVRAGATAAVRLPAGTSVPATIASVGTVATTATSGSGPSAQTSTTVEVLVTIADQTALGALDQAPVDVTLVAQQRSDVLTVPVAALLALAEGGYGVQVVDGATTRILAVTTGLFAGGRVEVEGEGLAPGMVVGVAG